MTVSGDTTEGRAYLDLRRLAKSQQRPTDELLNLYALEGFLDRLTRSKYRSSLVLKGGVLLAAFDERRPTRDVDLYAMDLNNDSESVKRVVYEIAEVELDDGLLFDLDGIHAVTIREGDEYFGIRVTVPCRLASAVVSFHVDVNVGDAVWPTPTEVAVPRLLGGELRPIGYPVEMVVAEKYVTALQRGSINTRWRDFADLYVLARRHQFEATALRKSIVTVATSREVIVTSLREAAPQYDEIAQPKWRAWVRKQGLEDRLPSDFASVITTVESFIEPLWADDNNEARWNPTSAEWQLSE